MAGNRALILVENLSVPFDRRVWRECGVLRDAGYEVVVICPQGADRDRERHAVVDGVEIHRFPLRPAAGGSLGHVREYAVALWRSLRIALRLGRFDAVQVCNPPDLLFMVALPLKLRGARIVFDQHDTAPELYLSRFDRDPDLIYRVLRALERITYRLSDVVITANENYRDLALGRGGKPADRVFSVRNAPDAARFRRAGADPGLRRGKPHLICWVGLMSLHEGLEYAVRALDALRSRRSDWHAAFVGSGEAYEPAVALAKELGLDGQVSFPGFLGDAELLRYLSTADVGLAPAPLSPHNDISTMVKVLEYMAMEVPIVAFDLRETRATAGEAAVYAKPNDVESFAAEIERLLDDPQERRRRGALGRRRLTGPLSWERSRQALLDAYRCALRA